MTGPGPRVRRLLAVGRRLYVCLLVLLLLHAVVTRRHALASLVSGGRPVLLLAALVASTGQLVLTASFWSLALRAAGRPVGLPVSLDATLRSLPARYLPGSLWYAAGRVALLQRSGVPVAASSTVAAVEMLLVPVVGFALGGAVFAATGTALPGGAAWIGPAAVLLAVAGSPPVLGRAVAALARRRGQPPPLPLSWRTYGLLTVVVAAFWCWSGGVFALYVAAFPGATTASSVLVAGAYALAWGTGWLAVFAPQGLGVFEVVLAALLPSSGVTGLAVLLGGYRALVLVRDLLCAGVASALAARRSHVDDRSPASTPAGS